MKTLNTEEILSYTQRTILGAKSRLIIISPYLQIDENYLNHLKTVSSRNVKIIIICGKSALRKQEIEKLQSIMKLELWFLINLHAKCIINENYGIISSMNLYEASMDNIELGVLISVKYNTNEFKKLENECYKILKKSKQYRFNIHKK